MISSLQLSKICDVSQGTVDRALHGRKGINEKTREKILAKATEYGYMPNPAAREIITGKNKTVIALIPGLHTPFFMDIMTQISESLKKAGLRLLISTVNNKEETLALLQEYVSRRYYAVILIPPEENILIPKTLIGIRIISLLSPCIGKNVFFISPNEVEVGKLATRYLINKGHKNIIHIAPTRQSQAVANRIEGYKREMNSNNLLPIVEYDIDSNKLINFIKKRHITAFFAHNDWIALTIIRILEKKQVLIPNDISVIGVDNSPTFTSLYSDITTVEYPINWLANEVLSFIQKGKSSGILSTLKVVRRSSA